jgi:hypothetical protein
MVCEDKNAAELSKKKIRTIVTGSRTRESWQYSAEILAHAPESVLEIFDFGSICLVSVRLAPRACWRFFILPQSVWSQSS